MSGTANASGIVIEQLAVGPADARVEGRVGLGWPGTDTDDLSGELRFSGYTLRWPGVAKGKLEGALGLSGSFRAPSVAGNLVLSEVSIQLPESGAAELKEIRVRTGGGDDEALSLREEESASPLDPVALDLNVELKSNSWVRGRGVEAEIKGVVDVAKRPGGALTYSGLLQTVRGTYEIYGRRFQIQKARARLDGGSELDPILDVSALHRVRAVRITALLQGRLSEPRLRFESDPELSETDIASYLILGRPASEAGARDQATLQSAAAQIGAGLAGNELERVLGRRLPIDLIDVRFEEGEESDKELAVGVGKYVGERTFLRYDRRFGREPVDEIHAEYRLTPRWSVESSAASDGEAGADILFHLEY
ncbi:MAG: translocation/assembly module TamB [Myxococcales bacterium]|nr:translocation/assembly module TamB [Myxococcales bacterium]